MSCNNVLNRKEFEPLYGVDKNKKVKEWCIKVEEFCDRSVVTYTYGQVGGKKTECKLVKTEGKNKGKKNETTHWEQAVLEAASRWKKKRDIEKYTLKGEESSSVVKLSPMLAQEYKKHMSKVKFPCYIQPKLDGYRMIYDKAGDVLLSRTGKEFVILRNTELHMQLRQLDLVFDGELYVHDPNFPFENYGILRKQKLSKAEEHEILKKIEYHVYDCIDELDFKRRIEKLSDGLRKPFVSKIKPVETFICNDEDEINMYHRKFMDAGYEGSIVRAAGGIYKCGYRSYDLLKKKDFDDGEYTIVDFTGESDRQSSSVNSEPLVVWVCETPAGKRFNVQSKGTREERKDLYKNGKVYVGKKLWVQYFGLTADGIPRFPKTLHAGAASIREEVY